MDNKFEYTFVQRRYASDLLIYEEILKTSLGIRDMQIIRDTRYCFLPSKMAIIIFLMDNNKIHIGGADTGLILVTGIYNVHIAYVISGNVKGTANVKKSLAVPQKVKGNSMTQKFHS